MGVDKIIAVKKDILELWSLIYQRLEAIVSQGSTGFMSPKLYLYD